MNQKDLLNQRNFQKSYFEDNYGGDMRPTNSNYVQKQVNRLLTFGAISRDQKILEIGCGFGRYSFPLIDLGYSLECLDLSDVLLESFRTKLSQNSEITLHCCDILEAPSKLYNKFDCLCGFFVLHHLHDPAAAFKIMKRLLKPNGRIIFLEPNPLNPLYYLQLLITPGMSWRGEKGILNMRAGLIKSQLSGAGFKNLEISRFGFFPPFITNTPIGLKLENYLEKLRVLDPILPFQLIKADTI